MFDKMLSKVGIGAAKVDTVLHSHEVMRGEFVTGEVRMKGGKTSQEIKRVYLELYTHYVYENEEGHEVSASAVLHALDIDEQFTLLADEEVVYDFELEVPLVTPVSLGPTKVTVKTGLDVSWAFDPKDHDVIRVLPDPATARLLAAAEDLGFVHTHKSGRCYEMHNPSGVPFVQAFDFKGKGAIGREIEEMEMLVIANEHGAEVELEVDQRNRGVGGWIADQMDLDERKIHFELAHDQDFGPGNFEDIFEQAYNHS